MILKIEKKIIHIILFLFLFYTTTVNAQIFNEIEVKGNKRLSVETVLMFSGLRTNIDYNTEDLNSAIKSLYETNYFKSNSVVAKKAENDIGATLGQPLIGRSEIGGPRTSLQFVSRKPEVAKGQVMLWMKPAQVRFQPGVMLHAISQCIADIAIPVALLQFDPWLPLGLALRTDGQQADRDQETDGILANR